jgi:hypothetical protein
MVYRYLNERFGLLALQQQKWKIGRLLELNDPLDCQPALKRSDGSEHISVGDDPYFAKIYDSLGIICYSAPINDPVIWSHYADCHRGMAFGFEFAPDDGLFEVRYPDDDSRAQLDYDQLESLKKIGDDEALRKVISHGFTREGEKLGIRKRASALHLPSWVRNDWATLFSQHAVTESEADRSWREVPYH